MSPSATKENGLAPAQRVTEVKETRQSSSTSQGASVRKTVSLRDATQRSVTTYRTEIGSSSEQFLASCASVETFFDSVAGIRLRQMPHNSSRWDKVLKWAEFFAAQVFSYADEVSQFADYADEAAHIIWASALSLIKLGPKYINVLEKAFGVFYSSGLTLGFFLRHHELLHASEELQLILAASFIDLLNLVTGITVEYTRKQLHVRFSASVFDERFTQTITSFFCQSDRFTDTVWATRLQSLAKPGDVSVDLVREFLLPADTVTRTLAVTRFIRRPRADYTSEWFSQRLTDFTRGGSETLLVTGKPTTGKTVLSEWIVERLQSLNGRRASEVITYTVDPDLKTEQTSLSVVKGLLLQTLQLNVGDNTLYKSLAAAYQLFAKGSPTAQVEDALWKALEGGLRSDRNQTIVIDGTDRLQGGEADTLKLLERLHSIASKHSKTKSIVFSRPLSAPVPKAYAHFSIEPEHVAQDLNYVAEYSFPTTQAFEGLSDKDRTTLISTLVTRAAGSFEWLIQALEILKAEKKSESILKKAETLPKTLPELIDLTLATIDLQNRDTKSLLAWLLAAERPLLIGEVRQLIELDTSNGTRAPRPTRVEDDVVHALGPLVDIRDGFVRLRNTAIKQNLLERAAAVTDFKNTGPFPFSIKEAHYDLAIRSVLYVKIYLTRSFQPTLEPLSHFALDELFNSYELLQYATRYWSTHFQASPMHEPATQHKIPPAFKSSFPDSTLLAVLEGSSYQFQFQITEAINYYLLTLSVRRLIHGESSESVLQTFLNLARTKQVVLKSGEINEYYYAAWKLATTLNLTSIATASAHKYIELTSAVTLTKSSEVTTHRLELLQYIITIQRETRVHERETIIYLEQLASIYITIGETEKATSYYQEIYELKVRVYGRTAPETRRSYQILTTAVQKSSKTEQIYEITKKEYEESIQTLSVTDSKRLSLTWSLVEYYEKQKDFRHLEEILVNLWQSLTSVSLSKDTKVQESRIDVALRYVELLKRQKRTQEAENILRTIWIDLEQTETESTTTVTRSRKIGEELQSIGAVDAARAVFAKLWAYYVKTGKQSSAEASAVSTSLTQTTRETTSETSYEVRTLIEIFETTIVTATTKTINTATVRNAVTLVNTFYEQKNWSEVIRVGTITLDKLWPAYTSKDIKAPLPTGYFSETIELISRLAFSYFRLHHIENAESIYRRFFYAVIATPNSSDELLASSSKTLIEFYQTHSSLEKTIVIYRDLYEELQKRHGKTNTLTINTLYTLGDISLQLSDIKNAEFAYLEIHTNLAEGTDFCHRDAIRAALALSTIYEQQRQYSSAQKVYSSLWHTFIKHGKEYGLKPDFAETLYEKFIRILRQETKADFESLHHFAVEYRKAAVRFYGISSEITLKATLQLAELNEENEKHREEAISLYEEADQKSREAAKGQVSESTLVAIQTARKRLPHLYSTSKLFTTTRAITLYTEEFQTQNSKYGHAHRDTLTWLSLLSFAYAKQGNKESTLKANQTLETSIFDILKKEKSSQKLADSALKIAQAYVNAGLKTDAENLLAQLRSQAVFGVSDISKFLGLAQGSKVDPLTWVFIVVFGVSLAGKKEIYSSAMADFINEIFLYEQYQRSISQKAPFLTTLVHGSRLLQFTKNINDVAGTARVQSQLIEYFSTTLAAPKTTNKTVLAEFLQLVLTDIHADEPDISILNTSISTVNEYADHGKFQEAHDLAFLLDRFQQFQGGYDSLVKIESGLKLALTVSGRGKAKPQDAKLRTALLGLSGTITKQILTTVRTSQQFSITDISIEQLNDVSGLLGDQQNLDDLEWLLTALWQARDAQPSWSSATVVSIGRRLVETQFSHGHQDLAINLCEDIAYNLRRVWGALDATTLELHVLLSSFYTAAGNYRKAQLVHEEVLRDTVSDKGEELPLAEASQIAVQHLELLKRAYQRLGGWDKQPQVYVDLYQQVAHVFGSEEGWKKAQPQSVEKWTPKGADSLGIWTRPENFEFMATGGRKHSNYLRKSSGSWNVLGQLHGQRLSRTYSSQSIST